MVWVPGRLRLHRPALRASLFVKVTGLVFLATSVVVSANIFFSMRESERLATAALQDEAEASVSGFAARAMNPVRFGDAPRIQSLIDEMVAMSDGDVTAVVVTGADGSLLGATGTSDPVLIDALRQAAAAAGEPTLAPHDTGFDLAGPVGAGSPDTRVGGVATRWGTARAVERAHAGDLANIATAIVILAVMMACAIVIVRRMISAPMQHLAKSLEDLAQGRYDLPITALDRNDEIGDFARHVADLRDRLRIARDDEEARDRDREMQIRVVAALRDGLNALSRRDLTTVIDTAFDERYEPLRADYNDTVAALRQTLSSVILSAGQIREGSDEMAGSADNLSQRTETQAATLEETAAALQQISARVTETASNARKAERIARGAQEQAQISEPIVREAIEAMAAIQNRSSQIAQIITLIDDISFQTNLLALNAGVEAARAGESGRGFAVVATEVRALAQRSSDAAREIKELVSGSTQQVDHGVELVRRSGEALSQFSGQVDDIAVLMTEVAQAADDQAHSVTEINVGVSQLDTVTQQNAAMVQQTTVAIHELRQRSTALADLLRDFRLDGTAPRNSLAAEIPNRSGTAPRGGRRAAA
ncbi:MAG: HAMP domain-containing methyl-accepting chemotaxis protein [Proteobacteria bacterium]|nr:HAMP domain-containing methyl-accepting chemotaxis protein [Pseudomonadota bacterium]